MVWGDKDTGAKIPLCLVDSIIHTYTVVFEGGLRKLWQVFQRLQFTLGRCGGLMVKAIVSESNGLGWRSGWGHCVVSLGKTLLTVPLSTQVCKWIPTNLMLPGVTLRWIKIPSREKCKYSQSLNDRNQDNLNLDGPLGSFAD